MFTLTYGKKTEDFENADSLIHIRERFEIPKRKNIYRQNTEGELEKITGDNFRAKLKNNDMLEALSDFTLGGM